MSHLHLKIHFLALIIVPYICLRKLFHVLYHKIMIIKMGGAATIIISLPYATFMGMITGAESKWELCLGSLWPSYPGDGAVGDWLLPYQLPKHSYCKVLEKVTSPTESNGWWDEFHIIPTLIESEYLLIKLTVVVGKGDGALSLQPAEPPTARSGGHTVNPRSIIAYFPACFPSRKKITTGLWATSKSLCQFHQSLGGHACIVQQWLQRDDHPPYRISRGLFFFTDWHPLILVSLLKAFQS